jgi:hypothetical protein
VEAVGEATVWSRWRRRSLVPTMILEHGGEGRADDTFPRAAVTVMQRRQLRRRRCGLDRCSWHQLPSSLM